MRFETKVYLNSFLTDCSYVFSGQSFLDLRFECGLVELEGDLLASVGEDEVLNCLGTALNLDGAPRHLAGSFGVFRVSPLGPLAVEVKASEGGFI